MVTQGQQSENRTRRKGRECETLNCPGRMKMHKRRNRSDHITRRLVCPICKLRLTTLERTIRAHTTDEDRAKAATVLAEWIANQAACPPANPLIRDLFSSLE